MTAQYITRAEEMAAERALQRRQNQFEKETAKVNIGTLIRDILKRLFAFVYSWYSLFSDSITQKSNKIRGLLQNKGHYAFRNQDCHFFQEKYIFSRTEFVTQVSFEV